MSDRWTALTGPGATATSDPALPVIDPQGLLDVARRLSAPGPPAPTDAALRRAVSSTYYAVFHTLLGAAARRFVGLDQGATPGFSLIYRSFDHGRIKRICKELQASTLRTEYRNALRKSSVSPQMTSFANAFPGLQELRHLADYDPATQFLVSDVVSCITIAEAAIADFLSAPQRERTDILALLMVDTRT